MNKELEDFTKDDPAPETVAEEVTGEDAPPPDADKPPESETVPVAALMAERQKRQDLEAENARLTAAADSPTPEAPSVFDDEAGAMAHLTAQFDNKLTTAVRNISRAPMMALHEDYEKQEAVFAEMAKADPSLVQRMDASGNPAKFAYDTAKNKSEYDAMQDMPAFREKLKAEIVAEMTAKGEEIPESLATMPANSGTDNDADDSLSSILNGR